MINLTVQRAFIFFKCGPKKLTFSWRKSIWVFLFFEKKKCI